MNMKSKIEAELECVKKEIEYFEKKKKDFESDTIYVNRRINGLLLRYYRIKEQIKQEGLLK